MGYFQIALSCFLELSVVLSADLSRLLTSDMPLVIAEGRLLVLPASHTWMASRTPDGLLGPKSKSAYAAANWTPQGTSAKRWKAIVNDTVDQKPVTGWANATISSSILDPQHQLYPAKLAVQFFTEMMIFLRLSPATTFAVST